MGANLTRGQLLYSHGRFGEAEVEIRKALAEEPDDPVALSLLALALAQQDRDDEALATAREAVGSGPDLPFTHYAMALVHLNREELLKARAAIKESLRLDQEDPDAWFILGNIHIARREYTEALEVLESGLEIDPEHTNCQNSRVLVLTQLGRRDEASSAIQGQLQRDPDNADTHANQGWAMLHANRPKDAAVYFREALRLEPDSEFAREGMLNALRARNPVFRLLLAYFMWMSRLSDRARWGVIIGGYVVFRILRVYARNNPDLMPWLAPPIILYILFCFLTWTGPTLANLMLRFNKFGKHVLSADEIRASNLVGASLLLSVLCGLVALLTFRYGPALAAGVFLVMIIPISGTFDLEPNEGRRRLAVYTSILFILGVGSVVLFAFGSKSAVVLGAAFLIGVAAFTWIALAISSRKPT